MRRYFVKMRGGSATPGKDSLPDILWSWLGAFFGIASISLLECSQVLGVDCILLIGSFGASAVLIYGAPKSPLAQPRNLLGGHVLSALVGVASFRLFPGTPWLAVAMAVSSAIALMQVTRTLHPPGGATALIAVIGGSKIHALGFGYALAPVGLGAGILLLTALLVNNIPHRRQYPAYWL